jgi:hypothetical protein
LASVPGQAEPHAHVDGGDDAAAQVEHARDVGWASGTRVSRSGMNTSCTREIGRPNNWPPMVDGDVFGDLPLGGASSASS